jgi:hypothetical protein
VASAMVISSLTRTLVGIRRRIYRLSSSMRGGYPGGRRSGDPGPGRKVRLGTTGGPYALHTGRRSAHRLVARAALAPLLTQDRRLFLRPGDQGAAGSNPVGPTEIKVCPLWSGTASSICSPWNDTYRALSGPRMARRRCTWARRWPSRPRYQACARAMPQYAAPRPAIKLIPMLSVASNRARSASSRSVS